MKKIFNTILLMIMSIQAFSQANIYQNYNADFEKGNISNWRAVEVSDGSVLSIENDVTKSSVFVTSDSYGGYYAAEFTWGLDPTIADIVFDLNKKVLPNTNYIFRAQAKTKSGPVVLRIHCTFYDIDGNILSDYNDGSWQLSDDYQQHEWAISTSPANTDFAVIGFRAFNTNFESDGRWPETEITTIIDDVQLWENSVGKEEYFISTHIEGSGTGNISLTPISLYGYYPLGATVTATINPYYRSEFNSWGGDVSGTTNSVVFTVDGHKNISATLTDLTGSLVEIVENPDNGSKAAKFTWKKDSEIDDIIFDLQPDVKPDIDYLFKANAKSLSGPCILRIHCTFYDKNGNVIGDYNDATWQLLEALSAHEWDIPTSPANSSFAVVGFRLFNTDGSRWPETDITTVIDDVEMLDKSLLGIDDLYSSNNFNIYPNPFIESTDFNYNLSSKRTVSLKVYDLKGSLIDVLADGEQKSGEYTVRWSGENSPKGVYIVRLDVSNRATQVFKIVKN